MIHQVTHEGSASMIVTEVSRVYVVIEVIDSSCYPIPIYCYN